ncbi:hypothetical protein ABPG74_020602 [Tetrahymena malaccensis]
MIINQPYQGDGIDQKQINVLVNQDNKQPTLKDKKGQKQNTFKQNEKRVLSFLNMFRNKDSVDFNKLNKTQSKAKRKEDRFLADREAEYLENGYNDFNLGQMVMSFPNPDNKNKEVKAEGITFREAMQIFDDNLNMLNPQMNAHEVDFQRKAFQLSFLLLDDYIDNTEEAQEAQKKKEEQDQKKRKQKAQQQAELEKQQKLQKEKSKDQQSLLQRGESQVQAGKEQGQQVYKRKIQGLSDAEITELLQEIRFIEENNEVPLIGNLQPGQSPDNKIPTKQDLNKDKNDQKGKKDNKDNKDNKNAKQQDKKENKTQNGLPQTQNLFTTVANEQNQLKDAQQPSTLNNLQLTQSSEELLFQLVEGTMNNDLSSFKNVKKKVNKGKFMYIRYYDKDDYDWIITNHVPKDFQTLFRMTLISKLTINGKLSTRSILNEEGTQIIVSIKASEDIIRQTASYYKHNKQIELGYADILSLEPCDNKYRPYRLKYLVRLAVKNAKKKRQTELDERTQQQKISGVMPIRNLREYQNMDDDQFWVDLGRKQLYFDGMLDEIATDIKINQDQELVEIIDDNDPLNMKLWAAYSLYLDYMIYYCSKMKVLKKFAKDQAKANPENQQDQAGQQNAAEIKKPGNNKKRPLNPFEKNAAFLYRLIFKQAIEDTNLNFLKVQSIFSGKQKLQNIWHRLEVENPIPPFSKFTNSPYEEHLLFWRTYEQNEFKQRSIFTNMEKIKICDIVVGDNVNVLKMLNQGLMLNYFPLHDPHQLKGDSALQYFQKVIENDILPEPELSEVQDRVRKLFLMLDTQADPSDFDTSSVIEDLSIRILKPWYLQIDTIRDYFGEKIAIYFKFLSSYTFHLSYISLIGVIIEIIIASIKYSHPETSAGFRFFFAIVIIIWQCAFIEFWKRDQAVFSLTYGQENFEQSEQERPSFKGYYKRSIANDQINYQYYNGLKRKAFFVFSLILSALVICLVIGIIFALFLFKAWLLENGYLLNAPFINPNTLIGILNSIQIIIFNQLYLYMNDWLSEKENHQTLMSYENSYISKIFMFTFCNTFNSCFIIAFFNDLFLIEKGNTTYIDFCKSDQKDGQRDCFEVLRTQIISIFLINLIKNIPELVVPLLKTFAKKALRDGHKNLIIHPFREIDSYIKDQFDLEPYTTNREIDGTVSDYMELVIQFAFLSLFGLAFPTSFLLAFVNNILEIQVDKTKLIYISRRPTPTGASDIGTWFILLEIISFLSVFANAGLIAFTSDTVTTNPTLAQNIDKYSQRIFFVTFLIFIFLKYFVSSFIDDVPEKVNIIKKRHNNCINSLLKGLSKTKARSMINGKPTQLFDLVQYPQIKQQVQKTKSLYEKVKQFNTEQLDPIIPDKKEIQLTKGDQQKKNAQSIFDQSQQPLLANQAQNISSFEIQK